MSELLISERGTANDLNSCNVVISKNCVDICDVQETSDVEYIVAEVDPVVISNFNEESSVCYEEDYTTVSEALNGDETPYPVYLVKSSNFEEAESDRQETPHFNNEVAILPDNYLSNSVEYLENGAIKTTSQTNTTFIDNHSRDGFSNFCLESASLRYKDPYSISNIVNDRKKKSRVGRSLFRSIKPYERKNGLPNAQSNSHLTQNWNRFPEEVQDNSERTNKCVSRNNRRRLLTRDCFPPYNSEILNNQNCESSLPIEKEDLPNKLRKSISSLLSKNTCIDAHKRFSKSKINGNLLYKSYPVLKNSDKKLPKKTSRPGNSKSTSVTDSVKTQPQTNRNDLLAFDLKDALRSDTSELKLAPKPKKTFSVLGSRKPQKPFKSSFYNILSENMASSNSAAYSIDDREGNEGGLYTEVTEQLQYINMLCAQIQEAEQKRPLSRTVKEQETTVTTNSVSATLQSKSKDIDKKDFKIKQDLLLEERKRPMPVLVLKLQDIQEVIGPISQDQSIKVSDYLKKIKTKCKQTVQNIDKSHVSYERSELNKKTNINNVKQKDASNASLTVSLTSDHKINRGSEPLNTSLRNGQTMRSLRKRSYDSSELKTSDDKKTQMAYRNVKKSKASRSSSDSELIQATSDNSVEPSAFLNFIGKPDLSVHCFSNSDKSRKKLSVNEMPMLLDETVADNAENSKTRLRNKLQKMPKLVQEKLGAEKGNKIKQNKVGDLKQSKNVTINTTIKKLPCSSSVETLHRRSNSRKIPHQNDNKIKSNNKSECVVNIQKTAKSNEALKKSSLPKQSDRDLEYQMMDTPTLVKLRSRVQTAPKTGVATSPLKLHIKKGISKEISSKYKPELDDKTVCIKTLNSVKQKTDKKVDTSKDVCKSNTEVKDIKVVLRRLDDGIKIMPSTTESKDEIQLKNIHSSATPQLSQGICCMCNKQNKSLWSTNKEVKKSKSISISLSSRMESLKNQIKELSEILQKSNKKRLISSRKFSKNSEELQEACNELTEVLNFKYGDLLKLKCVASECTSNTVSATTEAEMPVCVAEEIVPEDDGLSEHSILTPTKGCTSDLIDNKERNNNSNFESVNRTELLPNYINRYQVSEDENAAEIIQELLASIINQLQSSEIKDVGSESSDKDMQIATVINPVEELVTVQLNDDLQLQTENLEENERKLVTNIILSTEHNEDQVSKRMDPVSLKSENEHSVDDESITNVIVSVLDQVSCLDDKDLCKTSLEMASNVEEMPCETEDFAEEIDGLNEEIEDYAMKRDSDSDDYLPVNEFFVLDSWESEESDKSKDKTNYCNGGLLSEISNFDNLETDEIIEEKEEIVKELLTALINKI